MQEKKAEDDQEVEVSTHVDEERVVVTCDGSQNKKKKKKVCDNWVGHKALQEEAEMLFSGMIPRNDVMQNEVPTSLFSGKVSDFLWMA